MIHPSVSSISLESDRNSKFCMRTPADPLDRHQQLARTVRPAFERRPIPDLVSRLGEQPLSEHLATPGSLLIADQSEPVHAVQIGQSVGVALLLGLPVIADAIPSYEELRPFACLGDWDAGLSDYMRYRSAAARGSRGAGISASQIHDRPGR